MSTPNDDLLLLVSLPVTGQWGTLEELWSRHNLEDVLDALLRRYQLGECTGGGQGLGQQDIDLAVSRQLAGSLGAGAVEASAAGPARSRHGAALPGRRRHHPAAVASRPSSPSP
jgi:hypothetical protein